MNASTAKATANSIQRAEAEKKSVALRKRRAALKVSIPKMRAERIKEIEARFRERIKWAVESGETKTEITLSSDHKDRLRGMYKYLLTKVTRGYRGEERSWHHAWGEGYLKYAPWGKYVKLVLTHLRRDGFKCEVKGESTHHDDSAAYLNSGGECGSETPYYTQDTILTISW